MANYFFLYNTTTGVITQPYLGNADTWTNIPTGQSVLGVFPQEEASDTIRDAYNNPNYYLVQSNALVQKSNVSSLQLTDAQNARISELNSKCNMTILSGFSSSALGVSHNYDFNEEAQRNLSGRLSLINADPNYPASFSWKTTDSGIMTHTKEQFIQLCVDADTFKNNQVSKYWNLKAQVNLTTTVTNVTAIVW